jgi:hypothetical protein
MTFRGKIRWPLIRRSKHVRIGTELVQEEYGRAMADGREQVRAWAVDANYNVYMTDSDMMAKNKAVAAFQDAINQFRPARITKEEINKHG